MIIEALLSLVFAIPNLILDGMGIVSLPIVGFGSISQILGYFSFYVGNDILITMFSTVAFWASIKTGLGLLLFIYKLLPFI